MLTRKYRQEFLVQVGLALPRIDFNPRVTSMVTRDEVMAGDTGYLIGYERGTRYEPMKFEVYFGTKPDGSEVILDLGLHEITMTEDQKNQYFASLIERGLACLTKIIV